MNIQVAERRRNMRAAAACPVAVLDQRGHMLVRGRTANISENGLFAIFAANRPMPWQSAVTVEIALPAAGEGAGPRDKRFVRYLCRIVRKQRLGNLLGLGMEFLRKLA